MIASCVLMASTPAATVRVHTFGAGSPIGAVTADGVTFQAQDPALLDALGAAFILAATQLGDAIVVRDVLIRRDAMAEINRLALLAREVKP